MRSLALIASMLTMGCGHDDPPDKTLAVSVFKLVSDPDPAKTCRAHVATSDELAVTPSFTVCSTPAEAIIAGSDELTLVIDYGDVNFTEGTAVTAPVVTLTSDGAPVTASLGTTAQRDNEHAFFEVTFIVPSRPDTQLGISVSAATGYAVTLTSFPLTAPTLSISVEQCTAPACSLVAAVDNAAIHVVAGSTTAEIATLVSFVDGVSQPTPMQIQLVSRVGGGIEGIAYLPVPAGVSWSLSASSNNVAASFGPITLAAPAVSGSLGCGTTCTGGAQTTFKLSAPRHIHPTTGTVNVTVDNVPLISGGTVTLTSENVPAGTISGTLPLALPAATGKTMVIDAVIGGYPITTISTTLM